MFCESGEDFAVCFECVWSFCFTVEVYEVLDDLALDSGVDVASALPRGLFLSGYFGQVFRLSFQELAYLTSRR